MISELRLRGLGVIADAVVPFAPGLTVVTGETGAGKTMVLTGLGLVSGERADASLVRTGRPRADADCEWLLSAVDQARLQSTLDDAGVESEPDGEGAVLLVGRTVAAGGRSRAFAGGRPVPAATLAQVASALLAVHGQAEQLTLRDPRRQRDLLDAYAGAGALAARFDAQFGAWRTASSELADLLATRTDREREAALLRHGIAEVAALAPAVGEDLALKDEAAALAHVTDVLTALAAAHAALADDDGAGALVGSALRQVERAAALDPRLGDLAGRLGGLLDGLAQAADEVAEHARSLDADPDRLATVEERRHALGALKRRYGPELDDVLAWWEQAERTVAATDDLDERIAALRAQIDEAATAAWTTAQELTALRQEAAGRLGAAVSAELADLAMADARLDVHVETATSLTECTADGADTVTLLLAPHADVEPRPLHRGASGGELSRVMLAVEVVLAGVDSVPTLVFDEIDAGIGGKVAVEVGRRLARLARSTQVIVVTHLPQVAAFADRHVVVTKDADGRVTSTSVCVVDGPDRVRELVRMLSGLEDSASGAEHATELLALAQADRDRPARRGGRAPAGR